MDRATRIELYAVAVVVAASVVGAWTYFKPQPMPPGVHVEAPPSKFVRDVEKAPVVVERIIVYKPEAKEELKLPETIKADDKKHVVASVTTPNDERQHTITTIVDSQTGEFTTYDRVEPLPWIGVTTKSEVGAYLGLKNGQPAVRIAGRQEVLQIKSVRIGAVASVDITQSGVDSFVGIGAWARW
ncbi:MAG: hypothetical protein ACYCZR_00220 [Burkholderiales bacterium]